MKNGMNTKNAVHLLPGDSHDPEQKIIFYFCRYKRSKVQSNNNLSIFCVVDRYKFDLHN